ncbi:hypothetical protein MXB_5084 [Myxobolus squamalis]|nr:hypothetical protein MXB_5084 [Myxobolus squamalis]
MLNINVSLNNCNVQKDINSYFLFNEEKGETGPALLFDLLSKSINSNQLILKYVREI